MCPWPEACSDFIKSKCFFCNDELFETILNLRGNPAKALSSLEIPSVIRSVSPSLISSHPAAEHPSPSTVTMSNTEARYSSETGGTLYLHQQQICVSVFVQTSSDILYPCLSVRRGMEGTGQQTESDQHHSASRSSAHAPHLTGDHNIYHARKLKLKGTRRFISLESRVISDEGFTIFPLAWYAAHFLDCRWNVTVVITSSIEG